MTKQEGKHQVKKIVVNIGVGEGAQDIKLIQAASRDLALITGQQPKICRAKKAISEFKIREGDPIGVAVTLRGKRKDDFLKKLFSLVLPTLRDFQGLSLKRFDGHGNYSLGIAEQTVFPEIDASLIDKSRGLGITITTNAGSDKEGRKLLELLGMPFIKNGKS